MFRELSSKQRERADECLGQIVLFLIIANAAVKRLEELGLAEAAQPMRAKLDDLAYDVGNVRGCLRLL